MHESPDGWHGSIPALRAEVLGKSRYACLARLRRAAGEDVVLTIDVVPQLVGVAEAAQILGWDRRRVITYVDRGSFPSPVASLASGRVWRRDDVEAFARTIERRRERRPRR
jgi:hypothetical protein